MKKKILFYTDCPFFAGCENLIKNLLLDQTLNKKFELFFGYRYYKKYEIDLKNIGFPKNIKIIKLYLMGFDNYIFFKIGNQKKFFYVMLRLILKIFYYVSLSFIYNFFYQLIFIYKIKPDIIHINNGGYPGAKSSNYMALLANIFSIKVIYSVNNLAAKKNFFYYLFFHFIFEYLISKKTLFTTSSFHSKERLLQRNNNFNVEIIKNVINPRNLNLSKKLNELVKIKKNNKFKLFIGAGLLTEKKGFLWLCIVLNKLIKEKNATNFRLLIIGDGDQKEIIDEYINKNKISEYISLLGYKEFWFEYLQVADCFILPSLMDEDTPYVILEAMSYSKPIISTKVGGIPEMVVNDYNGFIFEPLNRKKFEDIFIKYMKLTKKEISLLGNNSKKHFHDKFNFQNSINKYINLYS